MQFEEYRPAAGPLTTRGMKKTSRSLQHSHKMKQVTVPLALDDQKQPKKKPLTTCVGMSCQGKRILS